MDFQKDVVQEIIPKTVSKHTNVKNALRSVLEYPISSLSIRDQATSNSSYAIIVENPFLCENALLMLKSVLSILRSNAVNPQNISIIVIEKWTTNEF